MTTTAQLLVPYCKLEDFDATTQTCASVFYGPAPTLIPPLSVSDSLAISAIIAGCWAIGFFIGEARRATIVG